MLRLVLDTNVWLDLLVFNEASAAPIRAAMQTGRAKVFVCQRAYAELERVLAYPLTKDRRLDVHEQVDCLRSVLEMAEPVVERPLPATLASLPRCADPDDQKFLELALAAPADCLITKDQALLDLAKRKLPFQILAPRDFGYYVDAKLA